MSTAPSALTTLALSGWWTAAARARESRRADRLFDDPWAGMLVGPSAAAAYEDAVAGDIADDLHAVITRYFDEVLLRATTAGGIRQVVLVACGLDTRAYRLPWPPRTRVIELDQPLVLAYKDCMLGLHGATAACERHAAGVDLRGPWTDVVRETGFDATQPTAWVIEQSLYFFEPRHAHALLEHITTLSVPGSCLGFDIVNDAMLVAPETGRWPSRMGQAGAPWLFACDDPAALLNGMGWDASVVEPGEGDADFGRHPYRLGQGNAEPRCFLVRAARA